MDNLRSRLPDDASRSQAGDRRVLDRRGGSQARGSVRTTPREEVADRSPMLNVLQLNPTLDRSGAEKQMVLLARGLPRDRFRGEGAALTRLGAMGGDLREAGIPVTAIGKRHKLDPFAFARLFGFLRARRFDVIQTWIFAANTYGR